MSDRRSKAETGEGAEENSSQGQRGPSDPLHPSPPQQSYYAHPQQSAHYPYPPSSTREGISHYASYRVRSGSAMPPHRGPPPPHHYGAPPVDPRSAAQGFHRWWEVDVTYLTIRFWEKIGLVSDIVPPTESLLKRRACSEAQPL